MSRFIGNPYIFESLLSRRWAGSTGLRSTLRSVGANSPFRASGSPPRSAWPDLAPTCRTGPSTMSRRPPMPVSGGPGGRFDELRAPRQRTRCMRRRLRLPQSWTWGRDARRTAPCRRLLDRVRRGRKRPTLGELLPGASPAVGCRAARKGIGYCSNTPAQGRGGGLQGCLPRLRVLLQAERNRLCRKALLRCRRPPCGNLRQ